MLLHPERYTDEQIERMLDDAPIVEPDIDEEWHQFKEGHRQHRQPMRWAAILITAAALSGISYAAIHHFQKTRENKQETIALPQQKPLAREVVWKKESQSIDSTMEKTDSTKKNLEMRVEAENGATAGKVEIAKRAKEEGLDAIHDTVHEMARDEARHGKAFAGLLKRYFG